MQKLKTRTSQHFGKGYNTYVSWLQTPMLWVYMHHVSMPDKVCVFKIWESCYLPLLLQLFSLFYCWHYYRCHHFPSLLPPSVQTWCPFCLAIAIVLSVKLSSLNTTLPLLKCSLSFSFESVPCLLNCMCGALRRWPLPGIERHPTGHLSHLISSLLWKGQKAAFESPLEVFSC